MSEHRPNKSLTATPVEYLCGNPDDVNGTGTSDEVYGLQGPEGVSANGGIKFNLIRTDLTSSPSDEPSDAKQWVGKSTD